MIAKSIPITQVKPELADAKRMAVDAIDKFLGLYFPYSDSLRAQAQSAKIIAGHWYSRVAGFHEDDDFLHLTRDMLLYLQSGGERSLVSDQLAYFFSGFMPSYGAARILLGMVNDGQPWREIQAFLHDLSYGNARAHVESFDWAQGQKKAQLEIQAWAQVMQTQVDRLAGMAQAQATPSAPPVQLAFVGPGLPPGVVVPPAAAPTGTLAPAAAPLAESVGSKLLEFALKRGPLLLVLLLWSPPLNSGEDEWLRKRDEEAQKQRLLVRDLQEQITAAVNTTNNECRPQRAANQENGAVCENDGYVLMESALQYTRLVDPPKGRGLDGLFEKLAPDGDPCPLPQTVTVPRPGKLVFIPTEATPPNTRYDFNGKPPSVIYPKFVVFEAKNISQGFEDSDSDGIKKKAKERLKNTCDGQQMGVPWTERRIPQALERQNPGAKNRASRDSKHKQIDKEGYARWLFVCLPGPIGGNTKLYVFIDVAASGMNLESMKPKERKSNQPESDASY